MALVKSLARRLVNTSAGRNLLGAMVVDDPELALKAAGWRLSHAAAWPSQETWPEDLHGFEDVAPLILSSNLANRGLAAMRLDEAALLWRLAQGVRGDVVVEIGRERGGSTLLLAAALGGEGVLHSYDPQTKLGSDDPDRELRSLLDRYGLGANVELHVVDSHVAEVPEGGLGLVLVDGDPSYEGTRLDFERFCRRLRPGGHALFHDAAPGGSRRPQLAPLMRAIAEGGEFEERPGAGTFVHFVRTG
jgi:predicted O-methyltransferase YrrM